MELTKTVHFSKFKIQVLNDKGWDFLTLQDPFCPCYTFMQVIYSGAILEVCMRKLVFYPEIVGFIEEEKDKFPTVRVQYAFNSPPKLITLDEDGQLKETIRVDNWKREHIIQFLKEKVKPSSDI